jgi:hypothetical protein
MVSITINPVAVAIDASAIQNYKSGVLPAKACRQSINHNVLAVGYDATGTAPYFIVKNSWSATCACPASTRSPMYGSDDQSICAPSAHGFFVQGESMAIFGSPWRTLRRARTRQALAESLFSQPTLWLS